ncbi:DMP19 family protein [Falseniella ignava]
MTSKIITVEEFYQLNEEDKLQSILELQNSSQYGQIIDLLLAFGLENLSGQLLSELARTYNNTFQAEEARTILEMVYEQERDAIWYYHYAVTSFRLLDDNNYDFESEAKTALYMLNKAIELAKKNQHEIIDWCIELIEISALKKVLEDSPQDYPLLHRSYFAYVDKMIQEMEIVQNQKITANLKNIAIEDIQNTEDVWDIINPVYDIVNIYGSYKDYLDSANIFTLEQRYLLAIIWYYIEVNNGGHYQFFDNSTGIVWEDALNGFKLFGMNEFASNFENVIEYFGGTIPFDREERWELLQKMEDENQDVFYEVLDQADNFVYDYDGQESELDYIKKNPEKFVFEAEKKS